MTAMVRKPDQSRAVAEQCSLSLIAEDITLFRALMQGSIDACNVFDALPDDVLAVKYSHTPGYRPTLLDGPRNAWHRRSTMTGAACGKGKTVAIEDNIVQASTPMMKGCSTMEGYMLDFDATRSASNRVGPPYYCNAVDVSRRRTAAYDDALNSYDLLPTPTRQMKPTKLSKPSANREGCIARSLVMISNTPPLDSIHHPAMSLACGMVDGLTAGKHFDEMTIYRGAHALEQSGDWKTM